MVARIPQSYIQKCKAIAHVLQGLFIFIAGCITIAVFTKGGFVGGGSKYFFALCFLSVPALIYLAMVPMWARTVKFANVWAFIGVDALFTILWLAAFISVAMYNSAGVKQGVKDKNLSDDDGNCKVFAYGSESKCNLSRTTVGFGVVIFILFALTTAISAYWAQHFRKTGESPFRGMAGGTGPNGRTQAPDFEGQKNNNDGNEWSAEMNDQDHGRTSDEYGLIPGAETDDGRHPGQPIPWSNVDNDTGYHGGSYNQPSALSPGGYDDYRPAQTGGHGTADVADTGYNGYDRFRDDLPNQQPQPQRNGGSSGYSFS